MGRKYKSYSYKEYKRIMDMLREGYKPPEISRVFGIPMKTIYHWKHDTVPPAAKWKAEPSKELAYVVGVDQGDGSVYKNELKYKYRIQLGVIDKEFAEVFSMTMAKLLNRKYIKPWWSEKEKEWKVAYHSKAFYLWYRECEEEGLQGFKEYIEHDIETIKYYLRGLFDSDGGNYRNKYIHLDNTNIGLLEYVQYLLEKYFDIKATGPHLVHKAGTQTVINGIETRYNNDYYRIHIHRKLHIQKFLEEIGFSIIRKQLGLKKDEKVLVEGIGY